MDKVKTVFDADGSGFFREVKGMDSSVQGFASKLGGIKSAISGLFVVTAVESFYTALKGIHDEFNDVAKALTVASKQTGANTTELQVWTSQMKKVGGETEDVVHIINKLAAAKEKALENPNGVEGKAFEKLGISQTKLATSDGAELFRALQEKISKVGNAIGSTGNLMDILGEKSLKYTNVFTQSFDKTENRLKQQGRLIQEELIDRYTALNKLNDETTFASAAVGGGKNGAGIAATGLEAGWLFTKAAVMHLLSMQLTANGNGALGSMVEENASDLEGATINTLTGGNTEESSKAQKQLMESRQKLEVAKKAAQDATEKAKYDTSSDEDKLKAKKTEQFYAALRVTQAGTENPNSIEYFTKVREYMLEKPKIKELQDKVDVKTNERNEKAGEYVDKAKQGIFGNLQVNDSLVSTGNFLGTSRSRLEDITVQQTDILRSIDSNIKDFLTRNPKAKDNDFPLLF